MSKDSITNLIRQYCDEELNDEQTAQVEQHLQDHPENMAIVDAERMLRKRIEAIVKADCPSAPAELVAQIKAEYAKYVDNEDNQAEISAFSPKPGIWLTNKANVFAVAASIALVIGAVLFGIFGRPIDSPRPEFSQASEATEAAESVGLEHISVATSKISLDEMHAKGSNTGELARSACCKQLGTDRIPEINLFSAGYEFKGGMACAVPHCDTSYHFFFKQLEGKGLVSIHMVKDTGIMDLDEGVPFESKMPLKTSRFYLNDRALNGDPCVVVFSDGEIMYLVMACISSDTEQVISTIQDLIVNKGR